MEGKFLIHRKIFESDIWEKPAYYLKIWIWIVGKANWKTIRRGGKTFNRGEFLTNYNQIIKENCWKIGWRTEYLKKDEVFDVLEGLRKAQRITTRKATRGLWIKVLNYDYFQTLPKHESNTEGNKESNRPATDWQQGKEKEGERRMKEISKESKTRKDLRIISLFASKKNISLEDKEKRQSFTQRNLKPAGLLAPYELAKIEEVMDWLQENTTFKWGLESVLKYIDEDLASLEEKSRIAKGDWKCNFGYWHKKRETCGHTNLTERKV